MWKDIVKLEMPMFKSMILMILNVRKIIKCWSNNYLYSADRLKKNLINDEIIISLLCSFCTSMHAKNPQQKIWPKAKNVSKIGKDWKTLVSFLCKSISDKET